VLLRHTGTYVFDYAAQEKVYQELHAMATAGAPVAPVDQNAQATTQYTPPAQVVAMQEAPAAAPKPVKGKSLKKKEATA
jgi:hypothetical protein